MGAKKRSNHPCIFISPISYSFTSLPLTTRRWFSLVKVSADYNLKKGHHCNRFGSLAQNKMPHFMLYNMAIPITFPLLPSRTWSPGLWRRWMAGHHRPAWIANSVFFWHDTLNGPGSLNVLPCMCHLLIDNLYSLPTWALTGQVAKWLASVAWRHLPSTSYYFHLDFHSWTFLMCLYRLITCTYVTM